MEPGSRVVRGLGVGQVVAEPLHLGGCGVGGDALGGGGQHVPAVLGLAERGGGCLECIGERGHPGLGGRLVGGGDGVGGRLRGRGVVAAAADLARRAVREAPGQLGGHLRQPPGDQVGAFLAGGQEDVAGGPVLVGRPCHPGLGVGQIAGRVVPSAGRGQRQGQGLAAGRPRGRRSDPGRQRLDLAGQDGGALGQAGLLVRSGGHPRACVDQVPLGATAGELAGDQRLEAGGAGAQCAQQHRKVGRVGVDSGRGPRGFGDRGEDADVLRLRGRGVADGLVQEGDERPAGGCALGRRERSARCRDLVVALGQGAQHGLGGGPACCLLAGVLGGAVPLGGLGEARAGLLGLDRGRGESGRRLVATCSRPGQQPPVARRDGQVVGRQVLGQLGAAAVGHRVRQPLDVGLLAAGAVLAGRGCGRGPSPRCGRSGRCGRGAAGRRAAPGRTPAGTSGTRPGAAAPPGRTGRRSCPSGR